MNKKLSVGVAISLIAIACTVTFVVTWTVSFNMYNDIIRGAVQRDEISTKLQEIDSFVRNNFLGEIDSDTVAFGIFSGYISGVGDKNTVYMSVQEYAKHSNEARGQLITSGIQAEKEESGYIIVTGIYPDSYAESVGVAKGDIITDIDSINVLEVGAEVAIRFLEGEENTKLNVMVLREGEVLEFSLIRQAIDIVSVESDVVNNIGFIKITAFNELTSNQFESALQSFVEANVRALLIDVRHNSSDIYTPVPDMVNNLIPAETVAFSVHRGGVQKDFIVTNESKIFPEEMENIPIIVLADSATSGAGELLAAVLKSHAGAQIVGQPTAGNVFLQQTQPLKDGSAVRVTVARIVLANGFDYSESGLSPDNHVEWTAEDYAIGSLQGDIDDLQILKAFEIIDTITTNVQGEGE